MVVALRMPAPQLGGLGSLIAAALGVGTASRAASPGSSTLEAVGRPRHRPLAGWRGPCTAEFALADCELDWPDEPEHLISMPPTFPLALHEAGRTAARESGKYAVNRVQVRGKAGEVIGTDGKQALVQGGFVFPFAEDLLVPAVPLFGSKELASERAVSIGLNEDWLFLVIGPWQVWLLSDGSRRFPDVMGAIPRAAGTRVVFDDRDAETSARRAGRVAATRRRRLQAVTLDLGRHVAVRTRKATEGEVVEVPLPRTRLQWPAGPGRAQSRPSRPGPGPGVPGVPLSEPGAADVCPRRQTASI